MKKIIKFLFGKKERGVPKMENPPAKPKMVTRITTNTFCDNKGLGIIKDGK